MFLLFIYDIGDEVDSTIKLFADRLPFDAENSICRWHNKTSIIHGQTFGVGWSLANAIQRQEMLLNANTHRKRHPIVHTYTTRGDDRLSVASKAYLKIELHEHLGWKSHVDAVTNKASRTLGFIQRISEDNVQQSEKTGIHLPCAVQARVCFVVWDPNKQNQIDQLEQIQRRALCFICGNYQRDASVTSMRKP